VSRDFEIGTVRPLRRVDCQSSTGLVCSVLSQDIGWEERLWITYFVSGGAKGLTRSIFNNYDTDLLSLYSKHGSKQVSFVVYINVKIMITYNNINSKGNSSISDSW